MNEIQLSKTSFCTNLRVTVCKGTEGITHSIFSFILEFGKGVPEGALKD